ncbi:MAG: hypothetical protein LBE13_00095 [Bacteroidales bacterium]|jgi:hypothetical protein|nr:hypothetical protein [Bacteroidales bacterium]
MNIICFINPEFYYRVSYLKNRRKWLNLKKPTNVSEVIISEIVSGKTKEYSVFADKYKVREFIFKKGLHDILPRLYGVWKDVQLIDFNTLPNQFVLKCNFGCGLNIICFDKTKLNIPETIIKLNNWMNIKVFTRSEPQYDLIERCIICEELIQDGYYNLPVDYKFMCVNGIPHHILVITERAEHSYKLYTYDLKWRKMEYMLKKHKRHDDDLPKPKNLDKMVKYANILAKDFKFVRVDLYDTGDKVFFGELTFTPEGGLIRYYTIDALQAMLDNK